MAIDARKVINGTFGTVYFDDEEVMDLTAFQAKFEFEKEEIKQCGSLAVDTKVLSYSGKGSLRTSKVNSRMIKKLLNQLKEGKDVRFTLVGKLADPDADGEERIAIKNVSFDDLTIFDFEVASPGEIESPFTFTDAESMDLI